MSNTGNNQNITQPNMSQRFWDLISSPTFVGLLVFLGSLIGIGILIWVVVTNLSTGLGLPLLALLSVLLLLAALLVFTTLIHLIGLSDPKSALGLPEGSVRALLALALLGLFSVMASSVLPGPTGSGPAATSGQAPDEFAKQMLTLVGTLMTAVISFYFGSATTSSSTGSASKLSATDSATTSPSTGASTTSSPTGSAAT
jgi:hypothetical protein